ncbi:MAG: phage portal protein family protein [Candidatus Hodarchaeales archaeon]
MAFLKKFADNGANFAAGPVGVPRTLAVSEEDQVQEAMRVPRLELENIYLNDPQAFNTINKSKQLIMQAGYEIRAYKKGIQSKYDDFFANIGKIGMRTNTTQMLSYIHHDKMLYGHAYVERIYDRAQTEILDLKMIDPKLMDFARDAENIIVVDRNQNPIGYTMNIGRRDDVFLGDTIPNTNDSPVTGNVVLKGTDIFLLAFRIAHFRMFTFGNRFDAVGIIEPAFKDIIRKHKIEDATANSIHNTASFPIVGYVGDNQRAASQTLMNSTLEAMQNLSHSRYMVFQHPTKLETLEVKHSEQVNEALKYFRGNEASASGMALGFSIGDGEAINRSTLSTQQKMLDISLESEAKATAQEFKVMILDEINRVNKFGSEAELIWGNVAAEEKNEKTGRLMDAVDSAVLAPEEVRPYILKSEGIVPDEKAFKKHQSSAKAKAVKKIPRRAFPGEEQAEE